MCFLRKPHDCCRPHARHDRFSLFWCLVAVAELVELPERRVNRRGQNQCELWWILQLEAKQPLHIRKLSSQVSLTKFGPVNILLRGLAEFKLGNTFLPMQNCSVSDDAVNNVHGQKGHRTHS